MEVRQVPGGEYDPVTASADDTGAARNEVAGLHGPALKVRLTAPPVEGAANEACIAFLADRLGIPRARLTIVSGQTSRDKLVQVEGVDAAALRRTFGL